jgi:hypothetical protein
MPLDMQLSSYGDQWYSLALMSKLFERMEAMEE